MKVTVNPYHKMAGVYSVELEAGNTSLATLNLTPSKAVYGERLVEVEGGQYRLWDPFKSKLAAAPLAISCIEVWESPQTRVVYSPD
jgi:fibrillarin-like pre-rRNA processing protein